MCSKSSGNGIVNIFRIFMLVVRCERMSLLEKVNSTMREAKERGLKIHHNSNT